MEGVSSGINDIHNSCTMEFSPCGGYRKCTTDELLQLCCVWGKGKTQLVGVGLMFSLRINQPCVAHEKQLVKLGICCLIDIAERA